MVSILLQVVNKQPKKPKEDENLRKEVEILQLLKHPNIVSCLDFYEDATSFHVVMEFLQVPPCSRQHYTPSNNENNNSNWFHSQKKGGEVFDKLVARKTYSELEARELVLVLLNAIKYCHDRSIVHRDLKCKFLFLFVTLSRIASVLYCSSLSSFTHTVNTFLIFRISLMNTGENLLLVSKDSDHLGSIKVADFGFATKVHGVEKLPQVYSPLFLVSLSLLFSLLFSLFLFFSSPVFPAFFLSPSSPSLYATITTLTPPTALNRSPLLFIHAILNFNMTPVRNTWVRGP